MPPKSLVLSPLFRNNANLVSRRSIPGLASKVGPGISPLYGLSTTNASSASISTPNYYGENIEYDPVTAKFWWIFQDANTPNNVIRMASATNITGPWTVETSAVISEAGHNLGSPFLAHFGSYWYIYYGRDDPGNIYAQRSTSVNTGYSATGITNPLVPIGAGGSWEDRRTFEPWVGKVGAHYYMLYMAENVANLYEKTGLAIADQPEGPFTKYAGNPVLAGDTGTWDTGQDKAADPYAFQVGDYWYVGVAGCVTGKQNWQTGFFSTQDFINYTPVPGNPILKRGSAGAWDTTAVWRGGVTLVNGIYYFSYSGLDGAGGGVARVGLTTISLV